MQVAVGAQMMTKHKAFMEKSPLVISPRTWYMRKWDLVTLVLLLFTAVVTPVEVAFLETSLWSILFWINRSVDALFVIDIFLNFFVAIVDPEDGQLIFHHPTIIKTYLRAGSPSTSSPSCPSTSCPSSSTTARWASSKSCAC
jgi:hypothetical protein